MTVVIALGISIAGASLVFYSWRHRGKALAAAAGWLLAMASVYPWSLALGAEIGVTYAIIVFMCLAWILVTATLQPASPGPQARHLFRALQWPAATTAFKHIALFLLSVPAAGAITMMLTVALVLYLPWAMPLKVAVVIFTYPVLWGGLSAWICAQDKLLKPILASLGLFAVSTLILFA